MPLTVGTNTYVDDATFVAYLAQSIAGLQLTTTSGSREAGLVTAFNIIERQTYEGEMTASPPTQTASFPRTGLTDRYGDAVSSSVVPQAVKDAQMELAIALLANAQVASQANASGNIRRLRAGSAEVEYFRPTEAGRFPAPVMELLGPFLDNGASLIGEAGGFAYGTDVESQFDEDDGYDLNRGFP